MNPVSEISLSSRCRSSYACRRERPFGRSRLLVATRAAPSATLTSPATEAAGLPRRFAPAPRGDAGSRTADEHGEPVPMPASSGLDFIDLVGLDDSTVWNCLQDALTYRVLVGKCPAKESSRSAAHTDSFNVKQLKSYRDNVTRNLAPTVARGFANAARAAGHTISTTSTVAAVANGAPQTPQPKRTPSQQPQPSLRQQTKSGSLSETLSGAASSRPVETPYCQTQVSKTTPTTAIESAAVAVSAAAAAGFGETQRVTLAASAQGPKAAANGGALQFQQRQTLQTPARNEGSEACVMMSLGACVVRREIAVPAALVPVEMPQMPHSATMTTTSSGSPFLDTAGAGAVMSGRRRGSRGVGRGPLLAAAGRLGNGNVKGTGPAWI